ncbi:MAG: hypothetical protein IJA47_03455 [Oscillospiraceae bacterium]|nr:hypothetical protein [Oscillospiraceae bacterium]
MAILKVRDAEGNVQEILTIRGEKGDKGDPGEFTGGELLKSHINNQNNPHSTTASQVGAAPAGFGLGGFPERTLRNIDDLDDLTGNGWYNLVSEFSDNGSPNRFFHLCGMEFPMASVLVGNVTSAGTEYDEYSGVWQEVRPLDNNAVIRRKQAYGGSWEEWEVENPPMVPGVEYRTTERCDDAPVYAKRISYTTTETIGGADTASDVTIPHGITNFNCLVRCNGNFKTYSLPAQAMAGGSVSINQVNYKAISLRLYKDTVSPCTFYFDLYYTKTT